MGSLYHSFKVKQILKVRALLIVGLFFVLCLILRQVDYKVNKYGIDKADRKDNVVYPGG